MRRTASFPIIAILLWALPCAAQTARTTVPKSGVNIQPAGIVLAPFQMTGLRGEAPAVQPVRVNFLPFVMTGLRGFIAAPTSVQVTLSSVVMTGLRGSTTAAALQINRNQFEKTGLR